MTAPDEIPQDIREAVNAARPDINFIHWDDAYFEDAVDEWIVPVEAYFAKKDESCNLGWNHSDMSVEFGDEVPNGLYYFVGDWIPGMHPDMHTFER